MIRLWISLERADPLDLGSAVEQVSNAGASGLHVDFCDAHFVPSLNGSVRQVAAITARSSLPVDVHLMAEQPEFLIGPLKEAGAHSVTFHAETTRYPTRIARMIRCAGMRAILAINPSTPAPVLDFSTPWIDGVSLLTSEPDGGSEGFLPAAVTARKAFLADLPTDIGICADGGVSLEHREQLIGAGFTDVVLGRSFLAAPDPVALVRAWR